VPPEEAGDHTDSGSSETWPEFEGRRTTADKILGLCLHVTNY